MSVLRLIVMLQFVAVLAAAPANSEPVATDGAGRALYVQYCAACHGENGEGQGHLESILSVQPVDLTQLKKTRGSAYSLEGLLRSIDGRGPFPGHTDSEMPVWGEVFLKDRSAPIADQIQAAGKLLLITYYVDSIQKD